MSRHLVGLAAAAAVFGLAVWEAPAAACGCFTPPDPASAIVQAGERILFAVHGGQVTAHIQIQYSGDAKDFGWLLPLPSVPTLELGSDEIFNQLSGRTAPYFYAALQFPACAGNEAPDLLAPWRDDGTAKDPLVYQDSIGPYDFAVLKADSKTDMLDWLKAHRYFVPTGTDTVVSQYLHAGAYFLALRLQSGKSVGDLQPVVVHYASDLPMIPLVLTSVTSQPLLSVWAFLLGDGRAIPRNYYHTVLDYAALDWKQLLSDGTPDYEDLVARAVSEAPGHHTFVTEFAGAARDVKAALFYPGRFGDLDVLRKTTDASGYLGYLRKNGYPFSAALVDILQKYIKLPPNLRVLFTPPSPANYYYNFDYWVANNPEAFAGFDLSFDALALTAEIEARIVKPMRAAAPLFDTAPYLTRFHTRLAPADMNVDPVFSYNPSLPGVTNVHNATATLVCGPRPNNRAWSTLVTDEGFPIDYSQPRPELPATLRLEILREAGAPEVVKDNRDAILRALGVPIEPKLGVGSTSGIGSPLGTSACAVRPRSTAGTGFAIAIVLFALVARARRRNRAA